MERPEKAAAAAAGGKGRSVAGKEGLGWWLDLLRKATLGEPVNKWRDCADMARSPAEARAAVVIAAEEEEESGDDGSQRRSF